MTGAPGVSSPSSSSDAPTLVRAGLVYTALRLALLAAAAAVLLLAGLPLPAALLGGLLASLVGSLLLLRRQRDDLAQALQARRARSLARRADEQRVRDHVEQVRRAQGTGRSAPS